MIEETVYRLYKTSKLMPPAKLIAALRERHPGALIHTHPDLIAAVGEAPDLAVHKYARAGECFIEKDAAPIRVVTR